jgi:hypothetical protein
MKKIAILSLCFASLVATAQNVKVDAGKKITGTSSTTINMDMGAAGGEMKIESASTFVVNVSGADENNYKAESTITKMKMSQEGGGQSTSYDSDNKADSSEMAQEIGKGLNKPAAILIDKKTGAVKDSSPEKVKDDEESGNPFAALMGGAKSPADVAAAAFFVIPTGKKAGDKWSDSSAASIPGLTAKKDYELQSVNGGMATLIVKTTTKGSISKEVQGMQLDMTINGTTAMTLTTDTKTGLVKKSVTTGNSEGSMDVMGQSINFTMSSSGSSVFE